VLFVILLPGHLILTLIYAHLSPLWRQIVFSSRWASIGAAASKI